MARKNEEEGDLIEKGEVLRNLTIQKLKGERLSILVVGEPSSGKSTLIDSMSDEGIYSFVSLNDQLQVSPYHCTFTGVPTTFYEITLNPWYERAWMRNLVELIRRANNNLIIILCVKITTDHLTPQNTIVSFSNFLYNYPSRSQKLNIIRKCILILTHADHCLIESNKLKANEMIWHNAFKGYFQRYGRIIGNTPVCLAAKERTIPGTNVDWVSVLWFCCMEIFTGINDIVRNHTIAGHVTAQLHAALEKGMKEGYVSLNNIKMVICGPPCVGKTAFRSLLLNNPRPFKHNSTPITARPVKAIERIAAGRKIWEEIGEEDLLHMLCDTICNTDKLNEPQSSYFESSKPSLDLSPPSMSKPTSSLLLSQPALPQQHSNTVHAPLSTIATPEPNSASKKIVEALAKERKGLQKLHEATWIHLLDSGGQPQFTDLLRMFVRGNSIYIIVMKVTESLHEKPTFVYSIAGKPLSTPKEMTMTNLQIIESFVRSVATTTRDQLGDKGQPAFAIVATHCDQSRLKRWLGWEETLIEKNEKLLSCLSEFLDLFIFYNHDSNELIFPVDNLCWWSREKISAEIRHRLLSSRSDISFSVKIPVRWYVFDLNMKEEASKESHGMISLQSCYTIGSKIGMNNTEVGQCLIYLDSMRLCIYYPNLLPHVVFTNPQFLVESLSNIVRVSFINDLRLILPKGVSLSVDVVQSLKKDGIFDGSLINSLGLKFFPNLFLESDLLSLLQHFCVISIIKAASDIPRYFMPILLPAERLPVELKLKFKQKIDPLLVTFNSNTVLHGFFPTLIVSLLSREEDPYFYIVSGSDNFPRQLRHAVKLNSEDIFGSVFLCEGYNSLEVYFTGHPRHCYLLRKVVLEGLSASAETLGYDQKKLKISALVHCTQKCHCVATNNDRPHSITFSDEQNPPLVGCSVEDLPVIELIDERQSCWLIDSKSAVPISNVLPEGILTQIHIPVILMAIREVCKWEQLGIYLNIKPYKLEEIKNENFSQIAACRMAMVNHWIETNTATRGKLMSALEGIERNDIVSYVKNLPTN